MGSSNWTLLTGELVQASLDRGVTTGIARPNGGGDFVFGYNSLVTDEGASGFFTNQANFTPTPANKGGSVRGCIQRGVSAGDINFAPFFFLLLQGTTTSDSGYIIGLEDNEPHKIIIRKGSVVTGVPSGDIGESGILRKSTESFTKGTWLHLRLDAIVNLNGDVIIKAFASDLDDNVVISPDWQPIPGLEDPDLVDSHGDGTCFVDDALGVNSGSQPYTSGRIGFGFYTKDISRRGVFDHLECLRQT